MDVTSPLSSLLLPNLEDIEPLDLEDMLSPPSSFTDNQDFLNALDELLATDEPTFPT